MTVRNRKTDAPGLKADEPDRATPAGTPAEGRPAPGRMAERVVGVLFLAAFLTYGSGSSIVAPLLDGPGYLSEIAANRVTFTLGAALMLLNSVAVVAIGVLLYPVLRRHSERIALGYAVSRVVEGVLLVIGVISLLSLVTVGEGYLEAAAGDEARFATLGALATRVDELSYQLGMAALGVGSLFFCFLLCRARLVPRALAVWGVAGYAVLLAGALLEIFDVGVGLLLSVPGGLFEVCFGIWLIVKGLRHVRQDVASPVRGSRHGGRNISRMKPAQ